MFLKDEACAFMFLLASNRIEKELLRVQSYSDLDKIRILSEFKELAKRNISQKEGLLDLINQIKSR